MSQFIPDFSSQQPPPETAPALGQPFRAGSSGSRRASRGSRGSRGPGALVGGLVVTALAVGTGAYLHFTSAEAASHDYLAAPAATAELRQVCLDSSKSVDADGQLSKKAAAEVVAQIRARAASAGAAVDTDPVGAQPALRLTARIVRKDSYQTDRQVGYVERVDIPSASGLSEARPASGNDVDTTADWADAKATVEAERAAVAQALHAGATAVETLLKKRSNGSDVIGCAGAALEAGSSGTAPSLLIVSDLRDTALRNPDGTSRTFKGDWSGASVHIVLACPSGRQRQCDRTAAAFTERLTKLGITEVEVYRPDRLDEAVAAWLGPA